RHAYTADDAGARAQGLIGFGWEARRDESGREGTLQHVNQVLLANHNCNFTGLKPPVLLGLFLGHDAPYPLRRGKSRPPVRVPAVGALTRSDPGLCLSLCVSAGWARPALFSVLFFPPTARA